MRRRWTMRVRRRTCCSAWRRWASCRRPLPRALDVHGLFSTERDVHGGFTDVSAFVRGTDPDLDVTVFWRDWSGDNPPRDNDLDGPMLEPAREGCPVSFVRVQKMLESNKAKAWLWDDEADRWERVNHWDIRPGMLVMLKRDVGGYGAMVHPVGACATAGGIQALRNWVDTVEYVRAVYATPKYIQTLSLSTPGMAAIGSRTSAPSTRKIGQIRSSTDSLFSRTSRRDQSALRMRRSRRDPVISSTSRRPAALRGLCLFMAASGAY